MPTSELIPTPMKGGSRQRTDANSVLNALEQFCGSQEPGTVVPSHTEWMTRLNASERSVRWALEELQRQGKIIRRRGASTYVAEPPARQNGGQNLVPPTLTDHRTVVAIATPDSSYFDQAMKLLFHQAEKLDLSVICRMVDPTSGAWPALPASSEDQQGFILFRRDLTPLAKQLQEAGHRVVLVGAPHNEILPGVPNVYGDHEQGGYLATQHLLELGHERIAFCSTEDYASTLRWVGHQQALREARKRGNHIEDSYVSLKQLESWKQDLAAGKAFFNSPSAPTGLILWNDHEAVMALGVLSRLGLRVPDDISLVGYDNLREGQLVHPALTTVFSPIEQQLQAALNVLTRSTPPPANYQMVVVPTLISRDSTAPVALR